MSRVRSNIVANLIGNVWTAVMSLVFVPVYLHYLGIEAYALIGVFATLQALFSVLDMGLGSTANRELARLTVEPEGAVVARNLIRTLEVIYWGVAIFIGAAIALLAPVITHHWIKPGALDPALIQKAITIMGVSAALQWPMGLYSGGMMGLQRQVLQSSLVAGMMTVRGVGAVLVLSLISSSIVTFFLWQVLISGFYTLLLRWMLWRSLPFASTSPIFEVAQFRRIWRFAAGLSGISLSVILLTQMDKVLLSRVLSLEMFGYYTLAGVTATSLTRLVGPVFYAVYPRFSQLVAAGEQDALKQLYHRSSQLMTVMILPAAIVISLFSKELLLLWTRDPITAGNTHTILSVLIIGTALNGLMNIPYALQLAYGMTKLAFYSNVIAVILLVPLMVFMASRYGAVGAASVWVLLNAGYIVFQLQLMHRRILRGEAFRWYLADVGAPLAAAAGVAIAARYLMPFQMPDLSMLVALSVVSGATLAAAFAASCHLRPLALAYFRQTGGASRFFR